MAGRSSFGFLGRFGRSGDLRAFDEGLRHCDIHPAQVPEGVKLAAVRIVQRVEDGGGEPSDADYRAAAALMAFCIQGEPRLAEVMGAGEAAHLAQRLERATDNEDGVDAALVLLALHAGLVSPEVRSQFALQIVSE